MILIIVLALVVMSVACVGTNCWMAFLGKEPPQAFTLLTGGLVGAVTGMLSKTTPTETVKTVPVAHPTSEVHVTNKPGDPVPTTTEVKA